MIKHLGNERGGIWAEMPAGVGQGVGVHSAARAAAMNAAIFL